MNCQSPSPPIFDSTSGSSSPSLSISISTDGFNRLQAFQVYLEMSGTIDSLTDSIAELRSQNVSSSIFEQFKSILRSKMPQIIQAESLQGEIDQLKRQIEQIKSETSSSN